MNDEQGATGRVIFVGAGPGAADLITLRGLRALEQADVVLHDALIDLSLQRHARQAQWIPVGKRGYRESAVQTEINAQLIRHAQRGALVVRLKGGDPSLFGRLEEELEALHAAGIATEVVPGVSAALAAAAGTLRPLTRRGSGRSVALSTAVTRDGELAAGRRADTEVFYMAGRKLAELSRRLIAAGWSADAPALVVSRALWPDQIATEHSVADLASAGVLHAGRPAVVTVGVGAGAVGGMPLRVDRPQAAPRSIGP
jgi:uroporphyrin-III C-methyltransferase